MINNWFRKSEALPHTGSMVIVVTDADRTYDAYFQNFLGDEIWETSSNFDNTERILFWRYKKLWEMYQKSTQNQKYIIVNLMNKTYASQKTKRRAEREGSIKRNSSGQPRRG